MNAEDMPAGEPTTSEGSPVSAEQLLLDGPPRYTRIEAARLAGVELERARQLWRSLGYASPGDTERVFTDADVDALRTATELRDAVLGDDRVELALARAMGQAMSKLAEWQIGTLSELVLTKAREPGDRADATVSEFDVAASLLPQIERLQRYVWRRHLFAASERMLTNGSGTTPPDAPTAPLGVGFADIVGFTSLSRGLTETGLSEFLEEFESHSSAVVTEHGGRMIKTLGDEVMFAADTPAATATIGLDLADRISTLDSRPDVRVGLAYGRVLHRLGDLYGTVVNLAARLTALARPGTVLIDRELAGAIERDTAFRVRSLRRVSVRGFAHLQPWLLRRGGRDAHPNRQGR